MRLPADYHWISHEYKTKLGCTHNFTILLYQLDRVSLWEPKLTATFVIPYNGSHPRWLNNNVTDLRWTPKVSSILSLAHQGMKFTFTNIFATQAHYMFIRFRRADRKDLVITSKVGVFVADVFNPDPRQPNAHGLSRKHILEAVEGSLKRLQTDYIDLYQVIIPIRNIWVKIESSHHWLLSIPFLMMSQWIKILVPQWGIEPQSLAFRASVITARPSRHCYIHPSKEKACPHVSSSEITLASLLALVLVTLPHIGHQCHSGLKSNGLSHSGQAS